MLCHNTHHFSDLCKTIIQPYRLSVLGICLFFSCIIPTESVAQQAHNTAVHDRSARETQNHEYIREPDHATPINYGPSKR